MGIFWLGFIAGGLAGIGIMLLVAWAVLALAFRNFPI